LTLTNANETKIKRKTQALSICYAGCETAGEKFGDNKPTKVINAENAEIDDINVIRDGDHLFLLQNKSENLLCNVT
jgi:hypothetical protein